MCSIRTGGLCILLSVLIHKYSAHAQAEDYNALDSLSQMPGTFSFSPLGIASIFQNLSLQAYIGSVILSDLPRSIEHNPSFPQYFSLEVGRSTRFFRSKMAFRTGLCYSSSQYQFDGSTYILPTSQGIMFENHDEELIYSRFRVLSLGLPLAFTYYPLREGNDSFSLAVGYEIGVNFSAQRKLAYKNRDRRTIEKLDDNFHIRTLYHNLHFRAGMGKYLHLFYKMPLLSVFDTDQADSPSILQHAFGLMIGKN